MTIITEEYRELNRQLHEQKAGYGTSGAHWRAMVRPLSHWGRKRILDWGCGVATLSKSLGPAYSVTNYDPCIPGLDAEPEPHPVVVCGDVLEHVEPDLLDNVLAELRRLTQEVAFFVIALQPSSRFLPDGRNCHLILESPDWWRGKIEAAGFTVKQQKPAERTHGLTWFILREA